MLRFSRWTTATFVLLVAVTACLSPTGPGGQHRPTGTYKVLLIGNSLTYENELPALLEALADSAGVQDLYVQTVAFPNFGLEDHYYQGIAVQEIRKGGWKYVVMQQGPSALLSSRENLVHWAGVLAEEIRAVGAIPAFYAVWPASIHFSDFVHVHNSYALAATTTGGALIPAGEAWRAAWALNANLPLYGADGFHPSPTGTYIVALMMLQLFYPELSPAGLPAAVTLSGFGIRYAIAAQHAPIVQAAAATAHATFGKPGTP